MKEPTAHNASQKKAQVYGWKFRDLLGGKIPSRLYEKETEWGPIFLEIPHGNASVILYTLGTGSQVKIEFYLSRKKWLRWGNAWEDRLRQLLATNHREKQKE